MTTFFRLFAVSFCLAISASALTPADANEGKGKGKGGEHSHKHKGGPKGHHHDYGRIDGPGGGPYINVNINFVEVDRRVIYDYYGDVARHGKCPPGLKKKHNGCLPPGLAKKWKVGYPLPREVIYYPVPADLMMRISAPPPGYRYVRVANDLLLIAAGTGMVAAAIEDLGRL